MNSSFSRDVARRSLFIGGSTFLWLGFFLADASTAQVYGLVEVFHTDELIAKSNVIPKEKDKEQSDWVSLYSLSVEVKKGDYLRLNAQAEITNDCDFLVRGHLAIDVREDNGIKQDKNLKRAGMLASQNCLLGDAMHHMPLYSNGYFVAESSGKIDILVRYMVSGTKEIPLSAKIEPFKKEDGAPPYGHLVVEQYRRYATGIDASKDGAFCLAQTSQSCNPLEYTFGPRQRRAHAYSAMLDLEENDIARIHGMATSEFTPGQSDVGGPDFTIYQDRQIQLSPHATHNQDRHFPRLPLWADAVVKVRKKQRSEFTSCLDVIGTGDLIHQYFIDSNRGYVIALLFRKPNEAGGPHQWLTGFGQSWGESTRDVTVNAPFSVVSEQDVEYAAKGVLRIIGFAQFEKPGRPQMVPMPVDCWIKTELFDESGVLVSGSSEPRKMMIQVAEDHLLQLEHLPMWVEQLVEVPTAGKYSIRLSVMCIGGRSDVSAHKLLAGRYGLLFEQYSAAQ